MSGPSVGQLLVAVAVYVTVVVVLGLVATRRAGSSPEEYFLAGRALGPAVLFMALFGTNATSFVLVGIPGLAREYGALTPADLYARHLGSRAVGFALFLLFTVYTTPYMVQAVKSAALILAESSGGRIPEHAAGLGVMVVALVYTSLGGMRATAWTNVFQGTLFLGFMVAAFFLMSSSMGGLTAAMERVRETDPELLRLGTGGLFEPRGWASWAVVLGLTSIGFPHMLVRLMSATDEHALKQVLAGFVAGGVASLATPSRDLR